MAEFEQGDPRIIGGPPEEMESKDAAKAETEPMSEPALSETLVVDGEQANGDATPAPEAVTGPPLTEVTEVPSLESRVDALSTAVIAIAGRIDRIVYAISHAKKVKGL